MDDIRAGKYMIIDHYVFSVIAEQDAVFSAWQRLFSFGRRYDVFCIWDAIVAFFGMIFG